MKYLKISISSDKGKMIYPVGYEAEIGNFAVDHLYYKDGIYLKLLLVIPDADYKTTMIRTGVEELTEKQTTDISEANETRVETLLDEVKLRRLELKATLGMTLTTEELDAIDITKPDSIFGTSKILADKIVELKAKEIK